MDPSELAGLFLEFLEKEHDVSPSDLRKALAQRDERAAHDRARTSSLVPLQAFSEKLGAFETVVKFLREAYGLKHGDIAGVVNRSEATIRGTYRNALAKHPEEFSLDRFEGHELLSDRSFPASLLSDRSLSVFEHLVTHLLTKGMKLRDIAQALDRDSRTVWTIKSRAKNKLGGDRSE